MALRLRKKRQDLEESPVTHGALQQKATIKATLDEADHLDYVDADKPAQALRTSARLNGPSETSTGGDATREAAIIRLHWQQEILDSRWENAMSKLIATDTPEKRVLSWVEHDIKSVLRHVFRIKRDPFNGENKVGEKGKSYGSKK
ncbi:unnamed protein product [Penicillium bialowiezense]